MRPLDLKLLRDLGGMKGQMTAVALVMACGLMMMIMARGLVAEVRSGLAPRDPVILYPPDGVADGTAVQAASAPR